MNKKSVTDWRKKAGVFVPLFLLRKPAILSRHISFSQSRHRQKMMLKRHTGFTLRMRELNHMSKRMFWQWDPLIAWQINQATGSCLFTHESRRNWWHLCHQKQNSSLEPKHVNLAYSFINEPDKHFLKFFFSFFIRLLWKRGRNAVYRGVKVEKLSMRPASKGIGSTGMSGRVRMVTKCTSSISS